MLKRRFTIFLVCIISLLVAVFSYLNLGRFGSSNERAIEADSRVREYVTEHSSEGFSCQVLMEKGFPERYPKRISDIYSMHQIVWSYEWHCEGKTERIEGVLAIYSDGKTVW